MPKEPTLAGSLGAPTSPCLYLHTHSFTCMYTVACNRLLTSFTSQMESLLRRLDELKEELEKRPTVVQGDTKASEEKVVEQVEPAPAAAEQSTKEQVWCRSTPEAHTCVCTDMQCYWASS